MNDVMIGHAHTPATNVNAPAFNMVEMTMIDVHRVIWSSATAGKLNDTAWVYYIRCACPERKTSNTTPLSRREAKLK
jgi:hypothetical protein